MPRRDRSNEDDDDFDDQPRRSRRDFRREDPDERIDTKPGLATTAAVLWLIWAGLLLLAFLIRAIILIGGVAADADINPVCGGADVILVFGIAAWSGIAGLQTIRGQAKSLTAFGVLSLVLPPAMVLMATAIAFFMGIEAGRDLDRGRNDLPFVMAIRSFIFSTLLTSGVMLAGIFALSANKRYKSWRSRQSRRGR